MCFSSTYRKCAQNNTLRFIVHAYIIMCAFVVWHGMAYLCLGFHYNEMCTNVNLCIFHECVAYSLKIYKLFRRLNHNYSHQLFSCSFRFYSFPFDCLYCSVKAQFNLLLLCLFGCSFIYLVAHATTNNCLITTIIGNICIWPRSSSATHKHTHD